MPTYTNLEDHDDIVARLREIPGLRDFPEDEFHDMLKISKITQYDRDDYIIKENEYDNWVFFIISGKVEVTKDNQSIKVLSQCGDIFGEIGIIEGAGRSASVHALEKTFCLAIDASFAEKIRQNKKKSALEQIFMEILARRLRATSDELTWAKKELDVIRKENTALRTLIGNLKVLNKKSLNLIEKEET
ncbi:MAG: cyclic nucleotide-binding domain-containing protein [Desulfobulbaceae bacterium]|nr:cyclic nucleotide-binding domain-containing protein [Desulfobulbaceae bacterium]MCK5544731.1 cyclic nucleotide-binding domain-containing protein [Desulfobulbaceae bacterium]